MGCWPARFGMGSYRSLAVVAGPSRWRRRPLLLLLIQRRLVIRGHQTGVAVLVDGFHADHDIVDRKAGKVMLTDRVKLTAKDGKTPITGLPNIPTATGLANSDERGVALVKQCYAVLNNAEQRIKELTGIGARFGRVYLIESILEPSRTVVPGFATLRVELRDGRVVAGVKVSETDATLTLVDQEVKKHELKKTEILERQPSPLSGMPDGLENRLTEREFVDLIAYLVSLKDRSPSQP